MGFPARSKGSCRAKARLPSRRLDGCRGPTRPVLPARPRGIGPGRGLLDLRGTMAANKRPELWVPLPVKRFLFDLKRVSHPDFWTPPRAHPDRFTRATPRHRASASTACSGLDGREDAKYRI